MLFEEGRSILAGNDFHSVPVPASLDVAVPVAAGFSYSAYRMAMLAVLAACLAVAGAMFWTIERTRVGAAIRASAEKPEIVDLLGMDAKRVHMLVFGVGTALVMLAGALAAPLNSVYPNMDGGFDRFLRRSGGRPQLRRGYLLGGAARGACCDTLSKVFVPVGAGAAVYVLMAAVLLWHPAGLFAAGRA